MITIIPAIDIIDGKCVRLTCGDFQTKKVYDQSPLEAAKRFENIGIQHLHLVDLDGARQRKIVNWKILEKIATQTSLKIDFGGGIQSNQDIEIAFKSGANQVTAGSVAIKNKPLVNHWLNQYGAEKIILGTDVSEDKIAIHGWQEQTEIYLFDFLTDYKMLGIKYVICTDISKDGMLAGPASDLYGKIKEKYSKIFLIASGGISSIYDIECLDQIGVNGVIIGKALYEGKIQLKELKVFLSHYS